ncbi:hypothetical protein JAAARDRAFT_51810 [Jaapia argillacea MUCL 33604]|uniref:JmjC domain-containing protein n=1 Tax=Jaapia argillacea MUCL 33604 TaxID=933084 RepID=A0A067P398_9AGAM|nr:hypothetical protein JAAARDRAFT_51810 [Jaapia argillacea MUCL 33604]
MSAESTTKPLHPWHLGVPPVPDNGFSHAYAIKGRKCDAKYPYFAGVAKSFQIHFAVFEAPYQLVQSTGIIGDIWVDISDDDPGVYYKISENTWVRWTDMTSPVYHPQLKDFYVLGGGTGNTVKTVAWRDGRDKNVLKKANEDRGLTCPSQIAVALRSHRNRAGVQAAKRKADNVVNVANHRKRKRERELREDEEDSGAQSQIGGAPLDAPTSGVFACPLVPPNRPLGVPSSAGPSNLGLGDGMRIPEQPLYRMPSERPSSVGLPAVDRWDYDGLHDPSPSYQEPLDLPSTSSNPQTISNWAKDVQASHHENALGLDLGFGEDSTGHPSPPPLSGPDPPSRPASPSGDYVNDSPLTALTELFDNLYLVNGREGTEFPVGSEQIEWANGMVSFLPWIRPKKGEGDDVRAVRIMAQAADALAGSNEDRMVYVINIRDYVRSPHHPTNEESEALLEVIKRNISRGRPVAIRGYRMTGIQPEFDKRSITNMKGSLINPINVQCAAKRLAFHTDPAAQDPEYHISVSLGEFVDLADNPNACLNLLDSYTVARSDMPWFISALMEQQAAMYLNRAQNYTLEINTEDFKRDKNRQTDEGRTDDDAGAMEKTTSQKKSTNGKDSTNRTGKAVNPKGKAVNPKGKAVDSKGKAVDSKGKAVDPKEKPANPTNNTLDELNEARQRELKLFGPQTMNPDAVTLMQWDLLTHGGYLTNLHHDPAGTATWMAILYGLKFWNLLEVNTEDAKEREAVQNAYFDASGAYMNDDDMELVNRSCTFALRPGDVLIQPPGIMHAVYSPMKTFATGGHFYMYDAMHLTELSRDLDHENGDLLTNQDHDATERLLINMALALPNHHDKPRLRIPFLALASMILWRDSYEPISKGGGAAYYSGMDCVRRELEGERQEAVRIIERVLDANKMNHEQITTELNRGGASYRDPGTATVDLSCLEGWACLNVDDTSGFYQNKRRRIQTLQ